jgi:hypothetical protein
MNEQLLKENKFIVEFDRKFNISKWQVNQVSRIMYENGEFSPIIFRLYASGDEGFFQRGVLDSPTKIHIHFLDDTGRVISYVGVFGKILKIESSDMAYHSDEFFQYEITVMPITVWNGTTPFVNYPKSINTVELDTDDEFDLEIDDDDDYTSYNNFGIDRDLF